MSNFTANFRRFHRSLSFTKEQLALVERLERQRHTLGKVRAVIDDPSGIFANLLINYISYIQHINNKDCLLVNHSAGAARLQNLRALSLTPRSYLKLYRLHRRPIGQLLLLNTHTYCPSLPLYRSRLDTILQIALPYINGENSVVIIHGSSNTPKNTRFRHWLALASTPGSIYALPLAPEILFKRKPLAAKSPRRKPNCGPNEVRTPLRHQIIPNSQFLIPNSLKIAA